MRTYSRTQTSPCTSGYETSAHVDVHFKYVLVQPHCSQPQVSYISSIQSYSAFVTGSRIRYSYQDQWQLLGQNEHHLEYHLAHLVNYHYMVSVWLSIGHITMSACYSAGVPRVFVFFVPCNLKYSSEVCLYARFAPYRSPALIPYGLM